MKRKIICILTIFAVGALLNSCEEMGGKEEKSVKDVIPAKAGIQKSKHIDSRLRGNDKGSKETLQVSKSLMVADFDTGEKPNNIGGSFGAWDKDPADFSQTCAESFDGINRHGFKGFGMKLEYDVDSQNAAYNGFWMLLQGLDATGYDNLTFWVKGDGQEGYTTVFKVELKNTSRQVGRYYVTNVTDAWQKITVPLKDIKGMSDFSSLTEFVIVFEDKAASNKKGVIYIDDISFTKNM